MKVSPSGSHLGANWEQAGASWSEGSEPNVILGFRVPTTIGLRKPPAGSPCSQLTPFASSSLPLLPEHPWIPGVSWEWAGVSWSEPNVILGPWIPGTFLEPQEAPSSLPLLPACSPCSQLALRASLGPWSKLGVSWSKPNAILGPWNLPGASGSPKLDLLAPSSLPSLPACSQSIPGSQKQAGIKLEQAGVSQMLY